MTKIHDRHGRSALCRSIACTRRAGAVWLALAACLAPWSPSAAQAPATPAQQLRIVGGLGQRQPVHAPRRAILDARHWRA